jgi:hypothetical protein
MDPNHICQGVIIGNSGVEPGPNSVLLSTEGNEYLIEFLGTDGYTWNYRVSEEAGKDLSNWVLGLCDPEAIVDYIPTSGEVNIGADPNTGIDGIKWNVNDGFESGEFSVTLDTFYPVGTTEVGIKTGGRVKVATGFIAGPHCGAGPSEATVVFGNYQDETTAITLASFNVQADAGVATLAWETAAEVDNAGFNLYRATSPDGPWVKVNGALIAAQGNAASGADYSFLDKPGYGVFYYRLEDVDYFGISTFHGSSPVMVARQFRRPMYRPTLPE